MKDKPRNYQEKAVNFALQTPGNYEMVDLGLGKTLIALYWANHIGLPLLVLGPLEVIYNVWPQEIMKWTPWQSYTILHGKHKLARLKEKHDIYLMNYESLPWFYKIIYHSGYRMKLMSVVFDESSWIKNPSSLRFKILQDLQPYFSPWRMNLSGSPSSKGLYGLWSQYYMLDGGQRLGTTRGSFTERFHVGPPPMNIKTARPGTKEWIYKTIKPITFRLDAKDHIELPELVINDIVMDLPPVLRSQYQEIEKDFALKAEERGGLSIANSAALSSNLRQFVQGCVYREERGKRTHDIYHDLKGKMLRDLLVGLNGKPVLIPISFRFEAIELQKLIGRTHTLIGQQSRPYNSQVINAWNKGKIDKVIVSPGTVAFGLNLQGGGSNIIWVGLTWITDHYWQLIGRLRRSGQESKTVVVNRILFRDTVDMVVANVLRSDTANQQDLLDAVRKYTMDKHF